MKKSNSDSVLTAKRSNRLLAAVLTAVAVSLASCQTTNSIPIDDAYYWPENEPKAAKSSPATTTESTAPTAMPIDEFASPAPSSIEYVNVQDTTVTIKIKK